MIMLYKLYNSIKYLGFILSIIFIIIISQAKIVMLIKNLFLKFVMKTTNQSKNCGNTIKKYQTQTNAQLKNNN